MSKPQFCSIDFETRSAVDLGACGVHVYARDPSTDILCMAYQLPGERDVQMWTLGQPFPADLAAALATPGTYLRAWNAHFERTLWQQLATPRYGWPDLPTERYVCTMALAMTAGMPAHLGQAASVLRVPMQKDDAGRRLMLKMCKPLKNGTWHELPADRERLYAYCAQDVRTEAAIWDALPPSMNRRERTIWLLDQRINDRGLGIDLPFVHAAVAMGQAESARLDAELLTLTGGVVSGATKLADLKRWLASVGYPVTSLNKAMLAELLARPDVTGRARRALELREEAGKSSVSKYVAMVLQAPAGRARGTMQYYGAATGRWAGRGVQPHNFPRGTISPPFLPDLVAWVTTGQRDLIDQLFDRPLHVLSALLRSAIIPTPGRVLDVADFNAIEARVVAWLADETTTLALFASGGKVYETMASAIFGIPVEQVAKDSRERQIAKAAVLGAGFGMGPVKFRDTVIAQSGFDPGETLAQRAIEAFRTTNSRIRALWRMTDETAVRVVSAGLTQRVEVPGSANRLGFHLHADWLCMTLPSGRSLWYYKPRIVQREMPWSTDERRDVRPAVQVQQLNGVTRQWESVDLYGGLLVENATQAVARDVLADAMLRCEALPGCAVVLTCHDEIVVENDPDASYDAFLDAMTTVPAWATGLPIAADGYRAMRYRK